MKKRWCGLLSVVVVLIFSSIGAQELETDLLTWREKHSKDQLKAQLAAIRSKYPGSPVPLYLEAYLEDNGDRAVDLYKRMIEQYPDSRFTDLALLKVAQYYYAIGSYVVCRQYLDNLTQQLPDSPLIPEANFLAARCLIATGYYVSAEEELKNIIKRYASSPFRDHARTELATLHELAKQNEKSGRTAAAIDQPIASPESRTGSGKYTIQIGAFQDKNNASRQQELYSQQGYLATVATKKVNNNLLYLVWVGDFETEDQAARFGEIFKNLYGIPFHVVKK